MFPFACEIYHRSIFSKLDSFACASHGIIFDIYVNKDFEKFRSILTYCLFGKWHVMLYSTLQINVTYDNCLISGLP